MVLLHGGSQKDAELIAANGLTAARCSRSRSSLTGRSTPRLRLSSATAMLETLPIGVMVFPGMGIRSNLADTAKRLGIAAVRWRMSAA